MCTGVMLKKRKKRVIILFACIILFLTLGSCLVSKPHQKRLKAVLCLNGENGIDSKITEENEFVLEDCREYLVDYSKEKQVFLYLNQEGAIVEQNMKTGEKNVTTFEELGINVEEGAEVHNLQYAPDGIGLSFIMEDSLYLWERESGKTIKVLDGCAGCEGYNAYQWYSTDKIYFLADEGWFDLKLWQRGKGQPELISRGIRGFVKSDSKNVMYQIGTYGKDYDSVYEIKYRIVQYNLEDGTSNVLEDIDPDVFILKIVDNRYLYYVEKTLWDNISKVCCIDLENGKSQCIYWTDKEIVGIIE